MCCVFDFKWNMFVLITEFSIELMLSQKVKVEQDC